MNQTGNEIWANPVNTVNLKIKTNMSRWVGLYKFTSSSLVWHKQLRVRALDGANLQQLYGRWAASVLYPVWIRGECVSPETVVHVLLSQQIQQRKQQLFIELVDLSLSSFSFKFFFFRLGQCLKKRTVQWLNFSATLAFILEYSLIAILWQWRAALHKPAYSLLKS